MKLKRRVVISAALALVACAGAVPPQDRDRRIEAVYQVAGVSRAEIFSATKIWIAENLHPVGPPIAHESATDGVLIGNGTIVFPCEGITCAAKRNWTVRFTMRSDIKDDSFGLQFSNVRLSWPPVSYGPPPYDGPVQTPEQWEPIKAKLLSLGQELAQAAGQSKKR